jgi:dTDP-4-dehydrorhamnose 3,5-epimerase
MKVEKLSLDGLLLLHLDIFSDERGFFTESYALRRYDEIGLPPFVQDNCSLSKKGTLRGMHYQSEPGQDKLIWVPQGKIFDVAVDMRTNSPTYGKYEAVELDVTKQLFIPKGFAHGFFVLSDSALLNYKVSHYYNAATEKGFFYDDPTIAITWPSTPTSVSQRDQKAPLFQEVQRV